MFSVKELNENRSWSSVGIQWKWCCHHRWSAHSDISWCFVCRPTAVQLTQFVLFFKHVTLEPGIFSGPYVTTFSVLQSFPACGLGDFLSSFFSRSSWIKALNATPSPSLSPTPLPFCPCCLHFSKIMHPAMCSHLCQIGNVRDSKMEKVVKQVAWESDLLVSSCSAFSLLPPSPPFPPPLPPPSPLPSSVCIYARSAVPYVFPSMQDEQCVVLRYLSNTAQWKSWCSLYWMCFTFMYKSVDTVIWYLHSYQVAFYRCCWLATLCCTIAYL